MIRIFAKIKNAQGGGNRFLMPVSLRYVKILAQEGIDWKGIHVIDAFSIVYSINIDMAKRVLRDIATKRMQEAGISEIVNASNADFDAL